MISFKDSAGRIVFRKKNQVKFGGAEIKNLDAFKEGFGITEFRKVIFKLEDYVWRIIFPSGLSHRDYIDIEVTDRKTGISYLNMRAVCLADTQCCMPVIDDTNISLYVRIADTERVAGFDMVEIITGEDDKIEFVYI